MNSLSFEHAVPLWVLPVMVLLVGLAVWLETRKKQRFLTGRIIAMILIGLSLLGLIFDPSYKVQSTEEILLLTPGFSVQHVDSLLRQNSNLKVMHTLECGDLRNSEPIDGDFFEKQGGDVKVIVGEGLSSASLEVMPDKNFKFIPSEPRGITKVYFPSDVEENEANVLKGIFNAESETRLRLIGPSGIEDSVVLKKTRNQPFVLSFTAKQKGKFVYHLEIQDSSRTYQEPVPLDVQEVRRLKILFLQQFPTAETRSLKNFLAERNHSLTLRYQVSKNTFTYEYINAPESSPNLISSKALREFDLLFIDVALLNLLTQNERKGLTSAIRAGLGAIVLQSDEAKNLQWFWPIQFKATKRDTALLQFSAQKRYILPVLPFDVSSDHEIYPVLKSGPRNLSGYTRQGLGKIAFMLLQETYRIKVEGNEKDYVMIWNPLIEKTSRKGFLDDISIATTFPYYQNEPLDVSVLSQDPMLLSDSLSMPLQEDFVVDNIWRARTWLDQPGWHTLQTNNSTLNYFVVSDDSWKSLRAANTITETGRAASKNDSPISQVTERRAISPFLFMAFFLLSAGFLWLIPKLG